MGLHQLVLKASSCRDTIDDYCIAKTMERQHLIEDMARKQQEAKDHQLAQQQMDSQRKQEEESRKQAEQAMYGNQQSQQQMFGQVWGQPMVAPPQQPKPQWGGGWGHAPNPYHQQQGYPPQQGGGMHPMMQQAMQNDQQKFMNQNYSPGQGYNPYAQNFKPTYPPWYQGPRF